MSLSSLFDNLLISSIFLKGSSSTGSFMFTRIGLLYCISSTASKSKAYAFSSPSLSILTHVFNAGTENCSIMNRMKQRASLRFAHAFAASSWVIRSLMLVIRSTFSSFHLFLSSESYSPRVSPIMHQANLSCNSVLT